MRIKAKIRRLPYFPPPHVPTAKERVEDPKQEPGFEVEAANHDAARAAIFAKLEGWGDRVRSCSLHTDGYFTIVLYKREPRAPR